MFLGKRTNRPWLRIDFSAVYSRVHNSADEKGKNRLLQQRNFLELFITCTGFRIAPDAKQGTCSRPV
jgi:hypothetical protein